MITIITPYIFLSDYILIFCTHLSGYMKDVFFVSNTSKFLFCISLTACRGFLFASKYLSLLPIAFHNFHNLLFSDMSLLTFSFQQHVCFIHIVHPQIFSVAESKPCFNLNQISVVKYQILLYREK